MIEIVAYSPEWPSEFKKFASQLRLALGELALRIDHIGSTSVQGWMPRTALNPGDGGGAHPRGSNRSGTDRLRSQSANFC